MKVNLDIDTLILDGVDGVDRTRLADGVRTELERLLGSTEVVSMPGREAALARQIAQRVHAELPSHVTSRFDGGER